MVTRFLKQVSVVLVLLVVTGCSVGYYLHSSRGQMDLMSRRVPISELVADPATPEKLRERLQRVQIARAFASEQLGLPEKKGYKTYADLGRGYAVWNVVATPEFSLQPIEWCFPVAGCVSYRGYFDEKKAQAFADKWRRKNHDVAVRGVAAYSTLGYFDDPVLNTMMHWDETQLISIIFHELAHQLFYVKNDTPFNESFARVVEREGMRRWTQSAGGEQAFERYLQRGKHGQCFARLVADARSQLQALYEPGGNEDTQRIAKADILAGLKQRYSDAQNDGAITDAYEGWFSQDLNNAHLASVGAYQQWLPALQGLLAQAGGDLASFYAAARELGALDKDVRTKALKALDSKNEAAGLPERAECEPAE